MLTSDHLRAEAFRLDDQGHPHAAIPQDRQTLGWANETGKAAMAAGGAGRALTTTDLRQPKSSRHAFQAAPRLPVRVVLDRVRQGYNVGALFRLCDAFLCERLVICGRDASHGARRLVQAAQGTHRWVPWEQRERAVEAVRTARAEGWRIVAVEQTSDAVGIDRFHPDRPVYLVFGAELAGVSQAVLDLADIAVAIPMRGMANSLNVAIAAAIILHSLALTPMVAGDEAS